MYITRSKFVKFYDKFYENYKAGRTLTLQDYVIFCGTEKRYGLISKFIEAKPVEVEYLLNNVESFKLRYPADVSEIELKHAEISQ